MAKYWVIKIGAFRGTADNGVPVKTYVYYGREVGSIAIIRYAYGADMTGWKKVKEFKGKWLYKEEIHFKLESLHEINNIASKFLIWKSKNQSVWKNSF